MAWFKKMFNSTSAPPSPDMFPADVTGFVKKYISSNVGLKQSSLTVFKHILMGAGVKVTPATLPEATDENFKDYYMLKFLRDSTTFSKDGLLFIQRLAQAEPAYTNVPPAALSTLSAAAAAAATNKDEEEEKQQPIQLTLHQTGHTPSESSSFSTPARNKTATTVTPWAPARQRMRHTHALQEKMQSQLAVHVWGNDDSMNKLTTDPALLRNIPSSRHLPLSAPMLMPVLIPTTTPALTTAIRNNDMLALMPASSSSALSSLARHSSVSGTLFDRNAAMTSAISHLVNLLPEDSDNNMVVKKSVTIDQDNNTITRSVDIVSSSSSSGGTTVVEERMRRLGPNHPSAAQFYEKLTASPLQDMWNSMDDVNDAFDELKIEAIN